MIKLFKGRGIFIPLINIIAILLVITYLAIAVFYLVKPVDPLGEKCTFDNFGCDSNINLFAAFGNFLLAGASVLAYGVARGVYWLIHRHK